MPACMTSIKNLALDYLDLYLVHWPQEIKKGGSVNADDVIGYDKGHTAVCWKVRSCDHGIEECNVTMGGNGVDILS